jgi:hypothetical protein
VEPVLVSYPPVLMGTVEMCSADVKKSKERSRFYAAIRYTYVYRLYPGTTGTRGGGGGGGVWLVFKEPENLWACTGAIAPGLLEAVVLVYWYTKWQLKLGRA